ncbi:MAG: pyridoxine 5'-phosphate synthase [Chitinispirillaceae bacterium]|nr:pyridoxine 5'-phosphate synthase [Chitinispirillaceae bacterium]
MASLGVNIDHIATIRQARGGKDPDPVHAAVIAELAGATGITAHLREDRRHIQDRDIYMLKQVVKTHLNLEMAPTNEMTAIAVDVLPFMATLVPEKREERTTEGGLSIREREKDLAKTIETLRNNNILVSLFIDPNINEIKAAHRVNATHVELHTGYYSNAASENSIMEELAKLKDAALAANKLGMRINAGHGLNYVNVGAISAINNVEELNIGHAIISRAVLTGLDTAIRDMLALL